MRILSIGEVLWDVIGTREFLGGAPLNFSASSQRLGNEVALVSSVGSDQRGTQAIQSIEALGLNSRFIQTIPDQNTGTAIAKMDDSGNATFLIRRPAAFDFTGREGVRFSDLAETKPDWIYFGTLAQTSAINEAMLRRLVERVPEAHRFYDMNLREGHWNLGLVQRLSSLASVIKLNESEARALSELSNGEKHFTLEGFCRLWSRVYGAKIICVTLGDRGCAVLSNDIFQTFEGYSVHVVDTIGAGDAFSAAFVHGFQLGWSMERTATFANALGAIVASRAGATPSWAMDDCLRMAGLSAVGSFDDPNGA